MAFTNIFSIIYSSFCCIAPFLSPSPSSVNVSPTPFFHFPLYITQTLLLLSPELLYFICF